MHNIYFIIVSIADIIEIWLVFFEILIILFVEYFVMLVVLVILPLKIEIFEFVFRLEI